MFQNQFFQSPSQKLQPNRNQLVAGSQEGEPSGKALPALRETNGVAEGLG